MNSQFNVISMYSFKGGAGRTVCTANLANLLAEQLGATPAKPLLLMDMDLDSAGLTVLLELEPHFKDALYSCSNLIRGDFDTGDRDQMVALFENGMVDVSLKLGLKRQGTIRFLGTEVVGRDELSISREKATERLGHLLGHCNEKGFVGVIIDSASGRQETAMMCHRHSDLIVYCCRLTQQFTIGTRNHLKQFMESFDEERGEIPAIVLLPVAVPVVDKTWEEVHRVRISALRTLEKNLKKQTPVTFIENGIGEVQSFKWAESVLQNKGKLTKDELEALKAFEETASQIRSLLEAKSRPEIVS